MSSMFCKKIYQCRNADWCARDFNPKSDEPGCFEQMTNADRIRSMTDEELAECFYEGKCPTKGAWDVCFREKDPHLEDCKQCWLDWLKQEVSE